MAEHSGSNLSEPHTDSDLETKRQGLLPTGLSKVSDLNLETRSPHSNPVAEISGEGHCAQINTTSVCFSHVVVSVRCSVNNSRVRWALFRHGGAAGAMGSIPARRVADGHGPNN